jgi:hypothetical protein
VNLDEELDAVGSPEVEDAGVYFVASHGLRYVGYGRSAGSAFLWAVEEEPAPTEVGGLEVAEVFEGPKD